MAHTAIGHFMNQKDFHPANFHNQKRVWIAKQKQKAQENLEKERYDLYAVASFRFFSVCIDRLGRTPLCTLRKETNTRETPSIYAPAPYVGSRNINVSKPSMIRKGMR